ncbi:DUF3857 domain-containing protein [Dysgonomonas massiliensis]|uniref:DUF3857 domain-containing protein n=1 Tax=Dysgonomonas massiliensis TaxID=2040292 RepID=UPI000C7764C3|nr:DUF3857 domain-containing protein [Dysgonomonas massiliensis]
MKRRTLTIICTLILSLSFPTLILGQSQYGKITMDEMKMTTCDIDSSASAVVLMKDGFTQFLYKDLTGQFVHEYTFRAKIKILKEDGLEYCENSIFYYVGRQIDSREELRGLSGTTYNLENGKITRTKLTKEFIVEEEHDGENRRTKFTMPGAKVGSVIEFKYTITSPFNYSIRDFDFQSYIPVQHVKYEIIIPEYFIYSTPIQGYERIDSKNEPTNVRITMRLRDEYNRPFTYDDNCSGVKQIHVGENLPAMKQEPFMWSRGDYISRLSFELRSFQFKYSMVKQYSTTWADIDKRLFELGSFGGSLKKTGIFKNDPKPATLDIAAASKIIMELRSKVKWNEKSSISASNLDKIMKEGLGDSGDLNFLGINALNAAGFEAFPIILSTRSNGRIPLTHPSITAFNYTILGVVIDNKLYTIDVADKYSIWNVLPDKTMVTKARIMQKDRTRWVDLSSSSKGIEYIMSTYKFDEYGQLVGDINTTYRGKSAYEFRKVYYQKHKDEADYIDNLSKAVGMSIENFKTDNLNSASGQVKRSFTIKPDNRLGDDLLYIDPMVIKHISENPFKSEERKFPVQFDYLQDYIQAINIIIPEGYVVEELPESISYMLDEEGNIKFTYQVSANEHSVSIQYRYDLKNLLILPEKYQDIKEFYAKIIEKCSEVIVLKKV